MITESLNVPNTKVIENDYIGMAMDLVAMRKRLRYKPVYDIFECNDFWMSVEEFENYCLDQPVRITGDLIKDQIRSFNCYV